MFLLYHFKNLKFWLPCLTDLIGLTINYSKAVYIIKKKVTSIAVGASAAELPQAPCSEEAPPAEPAFTRDHETSAFFHFYQFDQFILPLIFLTLSPRKYATNGSSLIK